MERENYHFKNAYIDILQSQTFNNILLLVFCNNSRKLTFKVHVITIFLTKKFKDLQLITLLII